MSAILEKTVKSIGFGGTQKRFSEKYVVGEWAALGPLLWLLDGITRELMLFSIVALAIGGLDDLLVDLIWIGRTMWRRLTVYRYTPSVAVDTLPPPDAPGRLAVFIGAWDESAVIGQMLRAALARFDHDDYRIYVGVYPNDLATRRAVGEVVLEDDRVIMVNGALPGPTTKAECLNRLWAQMLRDERRTGRTYKAIVLHDAEDVVHPAELRIFDRLIERSDLVQLPVLPLVDRTSRWVSGHYIEEFCEAHGKQLVVREAIGASMPSAGVGCALSRAAVAWMADQNGGLPFDADSLTEDYELGVKLPAFGGRGIFVRMRTTAGGSLVAVRAYFPATFQTAVRQKTRWMTGIALAGWDRLGWTAQPAEIWMRLRDRRAVLASIVVASAYLSAVLWLLCVALGRPPEISRAMGWLLLGNLALLLWRLAMRFAMVAPEYGWREGLRAVLRIAVSNVIAVTSAWRALRNYGRRALDTKLSWDKTSHHFPDELPCG
jgi:adsorption protein B